MAKIHFIVNPLRESIGQRWPYEEKKIEKITQDFAVHISRGRLHAELLVRKAINQGADLIVSVGGDSTLSEIVNGLYRASQGGGHVPKLALHCDLHAGDTRQSLKLDKTFESFLSRYLHGQAEETKIDLGEVTFTGDYGQKIRRIFVNAAGFGFSSVIVSQLSGNHRIKRTRWNFFKLIGRHVPFYKHANVSIKIDDKVAVDHRDVLTGLIHNGRFGGHGFELSPNSQVSDNQLEVTVILRSLSYRYLLAMIPLFAGLLHKVGFVRRFRGQKVEVDVHNPQRKVRVDFDGDCWGYLPLQVKVLPQSLTILR